MTADLYQEEKDLGNDQGSALWVRQRLQYCRRLSFSGALPGESDSWHLKYWKWPCGFMSGADYPLTDEQTKVQSQGIAWPRSPRIVTTQIGELVALALREGALPQFLFPLIPTVCSWVSLSFPRAERQGWRSTHCHGNQSKAQSDCSLHGCSSLVAAAGFTAGLWWGHWAIHHTYRRRRLLGPLMSFDINYTSSARRDQVHIEFSLPSQNSFPMPDSE